MKTTRTNAIWNCRNPHQGEYKRVLTVCSAGLLRSPTIAWVLQRDYNCNCRAAGIHDYALVPVDEVLVQWADTIICAEQSMLEYLTTKFDLSTKDIYVLDIPDAFGYRNPELIAMIKTKLMEQDFNEKS